MSLIFDLDCLRKDNDKKVRFRINRKGYYFWLKLRWFSITWTRCDIISEFSKFKSSIENVITDVENEVGFNRGSSNMGKLGILRRLYMVIENNEEEMNN